MIRKKTRPLICKLTALSAAIFIPEAKNNFLKSHSPSMSKTVSNLFLNKVSVFIASNFFLKFFLIFGH